MNRNEEMEQIDKAIATFPQRFGLRQYPGDVLSLSRYASYFSGDTMQLYVGIERRGKWDAFCKGTPEELRAQIVVLPEYPSPAPIAEAEQHHITDADEMERHINVQREAEERTRIGNTPTCEDCGKEQDHCVCESCPACGRNDCFNAECKGAAMRSPDFIIKIAADSIAQLRGVDVARVLDDCSDEERKPTARYIVAHRLDLAGEINSYWNDVLPWMEKHETDADCIVSPDTEMCVLCGVHHGDPCPTCNGKGFHAPQCPDSDANLPSPAEQPNWSIEEHANSGIVLTLRPKIAQLVADALEVIEPTGDDPDPAKTLATAITETLRRMEPEEEGKR